MTWIDVPGVTLPNRSEPIDFTVSGASGGGGGGVAPGSLQPLLNSPLGAWPLGDASGVSYVDRSGHNRTLVSFTYTPSAVADSLVSGHYAAATGIMYRGDAALRLSGALTVTLRVCITSAAAQCTLIQCGAQNETENENVLYDLSITAASLTPVYFAEQGAGTNIVALADTSLNLTLHQWHFVALRRAVDGSVTFNVDARPSYTLARSVPTGGSAGSFLVGGGISGLNYNHTGRHLKDVVLWDQRLTDPQVEAQRLGMGALS